MAVYFIHDAESHAVKIGTSVEIERRLRELQTSSPRDLVCIGTLPGGPEDEKRLHVMLAKFRIRGEWFRDDEDLMLMINRLMIEGGIPRTVQNELERRNNCRYGLKGVRVAMIARPSEPMEIHCSQWDRKGDLTLDLYPIGGRELLNGRPMPTMEENGGPLIFTAGDLLKARFSDPVGTFLSVKASDCVLISEWPIVCRCWCEDPDT